MLDVALSTAASIIIIPKPVDTTAVIVTVRSSSALSNQYRQYGSVLVLLWICLRVRDLFRFPKMVPLLVVYDISGSTSD